MKEKIEKVISHVEKEDNAVADIATHFENLWIEMEPIFTELDWI